MDVLPSAGLHGQLAAAVLGVAAVAAVALLFVLLTYEDQPPQDRSAPWDFVALGLALCGCTAALTGAARLQGGSPPGAASLGPLPAGVVMIAALVVHQYRAGTR